MNECPQPKEYLSGTSRKSLTLSKRDPMILVSGGGGGKTSKLLPVILRKMMLNASTLNSSAQYMSSAQYLTYSEKIMNKMQNPFLYFYN